MTKSQLDAKLKLADEAYIYERYDDALTYYKEILAEKPDDVEIAFRILICRVHCATLAQFNSISRSLRLEAPSLLAKVKNSPSVSYYSLGRVIQSMEKDFTNAVNVCYRAIMNHYREFSEVDSVLSETRHRISALSTASGAFGEKLYQTYTDPSIQQLCVRPLKNAVDLFQRSAAGLLNDDRFSQSLIDASRVNVFVGIIKKFEPTYRHPLYETKNTPSAQSANSVPQWFKIAFLLVSIILILVSIGLLCSKDANNIVVGFGLLFMGGGFFYGSIVLLSQNN